MFNKYRAQKVTHKGYSFASKLEAALFHMLTLLEKGGKIKDIKVQVSVKLLDKCNVRYIADFMVYDIELGDHVYYESKGFETTDWRIKREIWKGYGKHRLRIYGGSHTRLVFKEEIIPQP